MLDMKHYVSLLLSWYNILSTTGPVISQGAYSGQGQGPVNLAYVSCLGNEANLIECISTSGIGVANCYHGNDVGLVCSGMCSNYPMCSIMSIFIRNPSQLL